MVRDGQGGGLVQAVVGDVVVLEALFAGVDEVAHADGRAADVEVRLDGQHVLRLVEQRRGVVHDFHGVPSCGALRDADLVREVVRDALVEEQVELRQFLGGAKWSNAGGVLVVVFAEDLELFADLLQVLGEADDLLELAAMVPGGAQEVLLELFGELLPRRRLRSRGC